MLLLLNWLFALLMGDAFDDDDDTDSCGAGSRCSYKPRPVLVLVGGEVSLVLINWPAKSAPVPVPVLAVCW